ncbi:hypothetical protein ON010_g14579 [Phytophthora cinnamomi]|nr:hypothetical protein ON010_g14579 [Phytophthora cinnamomi]
MVNWQLTLRSFINMVRDRGLQLDMIVVDTKNGIKPHPTYYSGQPTESRSLNIMTEDKYKKHKQVSGAAWKGLMTTIRWMYTFTLLHDWFEDLDKYLNDDDEYPSPSNDEEAAKLVEEKKLDEQRRKNLDDNLEALNDAILKSVHDIRRQTIEECDHDDNLQRLHDDSEAAAPAYGEAQKRYEKAKEAVRGSNSKSVRSALKAATAAMQATKAVFQAKAKRYSDASQVSGSELKGRGLRGAGVVPLEGVVRRGRTYNLNEIQGLATPSAYTYKQLGSKYIRIPDLDAKTLVIVQPNWRTCGPKCQMSDSLQAMIRTLVYKNHIDQASYDKLSIDDKKLVKEILAISHLQYNFHDKLTDPLETLRAEYDKLKGEMKLDNDNPSIIKQLKSLTVDINMFFFNPRIMSSSGGSYGDNADLNVAEPKAIMKNLIIHNRPQKPQTAVWATDLDKSI